MKRIMISIKEIAVCSQHVVNEGAAFLWPFHMVLRCGDEARGDGGSLADVEESSAYTGRNKCNLICIP